MRNSWHTKKIGDIILENKKSILKSRGNQDGQYPFFVSGYNIKSINKFLVEGKNIYLPTGGNFFVHFYDGKAAYSTDTWSITTREEVNIKYLYYFLILNAEFISNKLFKGATIKHLQKKDFKNLVVPLPSLSEQKEIVNKLDDFFEKVSTVENNTQKNVQNAKELYEAYAREVFTKKVGWSVKTLGDVCKLYQGIAINAKTKHVLVERSELPLLRIKDLRNNSAEQFVNPKCYPPNALVNESDILYTRTGNSLGLVFRGRKGVLHNNSFKVVPNSEVDKDFLYLWLQNPLFKAKIFSLASKTAQPDITHTIFKAQEIAIPTISEQKTVVKKLESLLVETTKLTKTYEQRLANLEQLKRSTLKMAFSGELSIAASPVSVSPQVAISASSPYIRNQVHAAIVDQVVRDNGSTTEVAVAKYDHLLQELCGLPLGYQFATHQFGPFDNQIKRLVSSGLGKNKWFTKRSGMIVFGSNVSALLSRQSNLYHSAQASMKELSRLGITKLDADGVELLSTVCHSIKETGSVAIDSIRTFMSNWQTDNNARTKADKFSEERTQKCLDFILKNNLHQKLLPTT